MDDGTLLPRPRRLEIAWPAWRAGRPAPRSGPPDGPPSSALSTLERTLVAAAAPDAAEVPLAAERDPALAAEGFRLVAGPDGIAIAHADDAGLAHALRRLAQWVRARAAADGSVPGLTVQDAPAIAERGVVLDVSRDRVPRMDRLLELVERLADWGCNRLQLYNEAAFAHPDFVEAWRGADPFTPDEIRDLDARCAELGIELVANQQSFGHLHRFLVHDRWRNLAERPDGVEHPFSIVREPFSLCPLDPGALRFLGRLYDGLLPCFRSDAVHVGLDETFDLGTGRSREACERRGTHTVYLEFVRAVHALLAERGKRMQMWADIVLESPRRVSELPGDVELFAWGYEADHPFERDLARLAASGLPFHACPGTSSWNSVGGRIDNALANLENAAVNAVRHGARGMWIADWGDRGHHQPPVVALVPLAAGLALAWNPDDRRTVREWARVVDREALGDSGTVGDALVELGRLDDANDARSVNGTALFHALAYAHEDWPHPRAEGMTERGALASDAAARALRDRMRATPMPNADAAERAEEIAWAADLLGVAARLAAARCRNPGTPLDALPDAPALAGDLDVSIARHRDLWLRHSRLGGLERSCAVLVRASRTLRGHGRTRRAPRTDPGER